MVNIYLTRHGETQWNRENRLQGSKDSLLTDKGIKNAVLLGNRLSDIDFNAIYSSPIERALQTAKYIKLNKEVPIYTVEDLKEIHFGNWEGKTKEEIVAVETDKKEYQNFWNNPHTYNHKPHNGESLRTFKNRVEKAVRGVISYNEDGN